MKQEWVKRELFRTIGCARNRARDPDVLYLVADYEEKTQKWLDQPIGIIHGDMQISDAMQTRLKDHPFIEFINKIQMDIANVSISCTSLFHNTSPGFPNM